MGGNNSKEEEQTQLLFQIQQQLIKSQLEIQKLKHNTSTSVQPQPQAQQQQPFSLNEVLKNPELQQALKNNPERRKIILEQLLKQYSHLMTREQVEKMRQLIFNEDIRKPSSLPPTSLLPFIPPSDENTRSLAIATNQMSISNFKNSNELTHHYETEIEREQREFEEEQERRRLEFMKRQKTRRNEYESKLNELEGQNVDALKLFELSSNYTMESLKSSYRKLALKNHPDKPGGNASKFEFITKCYFLLLERLKRDTTSTNTKTTPTSTSNYDFTPTTADIKQAKENFNIRKFNEIFEKHKLYDPNEEGYDDWLKSGETTPSQPVFSAKFNIDVFNSTFDNWKSATPQNINNSITTYDEPQALVSCNTIGFTDIDVSSKKHFTRHQETARDLSYSDLKGAYTTDNTLINPNSISYKTYKNVDELERDRSNISYKLSPEEEYRIARKKLQDEEAEELRRQRIYQRDTVVEQTYSKAHQQMLGFNRSSDTSNSKALPAPVHPRNLPAPPPALTYNPNPNQRHIQNQNQNKEETLYIKY